MVDLELSYFGSSSLDWCCHPKLVSSFCYVWGRQERWETRLFWVEQMVLATETWRLCDSFGFRTGCSISELMDREMLIIEFLFFFMGLNSISRKKPCIAVILKVYNLEHKKMAQLIWWANGRWPPVPIGRLVPAAGVVDVVDAPHSIYGITCFIITDWVKFTCLPSHSNLFLPVRFITLIFAHSK